MAGGEGGSAGSDAAGRSIAAETESWFETFGAWTLRVLAGGLLSLLLGMCIVEGRPAKLALLACFGAVIAGFGLLDRAAVALGAPGVADWLRDIARVRRRSTLTVLQDIYVGIVAHALAFRLRVRVLDDSSESLQWLVTPGQVVVAVASTVVLHVLLGSAVLFVARGGRLRPAHEATSRERAAARWRWARLGWAGPALQWGLLGVAANAPLLLFALGAGAATRWWRFAATLLALASFAVVMAAAQRLARRGSPRVAAWIELGASCRFVVGSVCWLDSLPYMVHGPVHRGAGEPRGLLAIAGGALLHALVAQAAGMAIALVVRWWNERGDAKSAAPQRAVAG